MARHSQESGGLPIVPIIVMGGIGYYLYSQGYFASWFSSIVPSSSSPINSSNLSNPVISAINPTVLVAMGNPPTSTTPISAPTPPNPGNVPLPIATSTGLISQQISEAAGTDLLNVDQWCYYYQQITGLACPDPDNIPGIDRTTPITVGQWLGLFSSQIPGLSGLGCNCKPTDKLGLGQILDFSDFFALQPRRKHITGNFK